MFVSSGVYFSVLLVYGCCIPAHIQVNVYLCCWIIKRCSIGYYAGKKRIRSPRYKQIIIKSFACRTIDR